MHRFCKSIKKFIPIRKNQIYAAFCFSLLHNSTELDQKVAYFKLICVISLSIHKTKTYVEAFSKIEKLIEQRPTDRAQVNNILGKDWQEIVDDLVILNLNG